MTAQASQRHYRKALYLSLLCVWNSPPSVTPPPFLKSPRNPQNDKTDKSGRTSPRHPFDPPPPPASTDCCIVVLQTASHRCNVLNLKGFPAVPVNEYFFPITRVEFAFPILNSQGVLPFLLCQHNSHFATGFDANSDRN